MNRLFFTTQVTRMKSKTFTSLLLALPLAATLLGGCKKDTPATPTPTTASMALEVELVAGGAPLTLNTQTYRKADGQAYTVTGFKFIVSNVKLTKADGSSYAVPDGYYLVDAAKPASSRIALSGVPVGDYTGLSFVVGLDAAHNNAIFQSGDINHNADFFWDMPPVSGYVFLKMAGASPQSTTRALTFDIGSNECARTVTVGFNGNVLPVKSATEPEVHLTADVNGLFESTTPARRIDFSVVHDVASGNAWAPVVADNYAAGMFKFEHIHTY